MFLDRVGNERYKILFLDTKENMKKTSILSARSSMLKSFLFVSNSYSTCLKLSKGKLILDKRALNSFFKSIKKKRKDNDIWFYLCHLQTLFDGNYKRK